MKQFVKYMSGCYCKSFEFFFKLPLEDKLYFWFGVAGVNGDYGDLSRAAVKKYQIDKHLTPCGLITDELVESLGI